MSLLSVAPGADANLFIQKSLCGSVTQWGLTRKTGFFPSNGADQLSGVPQVQSGCASTLFMAENAAKGNSPLLPRRFQS